MPRLRTACAVAACLLAPAARAADTSPRIAAPGPAHDGRSGTRGGFRPRGAEHARPQRADKAAVDDWDGSLATDERPGG